LMALRIAVSDMINFVGAFTLMGLKMLVSNMLDIV
jgi:hypothetical protein